MQMPITPQSIKSEKSSILQCKLCGSPIKNNIWFNQTNNHDCFCCNGCKMVYSMLMESEQSASPEDFKKSDLYQKCVAAGIIPQPDTSDTRTSHNGSENPETENNASSVDSANTLIWAFSVDNMWCPACAWVVEEILRKTKGVIEASCNFTTDRGKVSYNPVITSPHALEIAIENLGYQVNGLVDSPKKNTKEFIRLAITLFLTMNIMMFSWSIFSGFFWQLSKISVQMLSWPVFVMSTIVLCYGGYPIHKKALRGILTKSLGMETLISIGSITAYGYSVFQLLRESIHLYFDTSSMLVLLILFGKRLEQSSKEKIVSGLTDFFSLTPKKVKRCCERFPNGHYVPATRLKVGDLFQVEAGEVLAADGIALKGEAAIDESSITGEVKPLHVSKGTHVKSGTQIISGQILIKALKVGEESVLGKMITIMENTLSGKTRQSKKFDGILKTFVPFILCISLLSYLFGVFIGLSPHESLNRSLSVLVISCPCALGIAIPLALTAGASLAGKIGILVRDLEAFEKVYGLDSVVFDKTGTLTNGKMELITILTTNSITSKEVLQLACAMETNSNHYIAEAIKAYGSDHGIKHLQVEKLSFDSNGIQGIFKGRKVRLGSRNFVADSEIPHFNGDITTDNSQLISEIFLSINDKVVASLQFGDTIKDDVEDLIKCLKRKGLSLYLVSGDGEYATQFVGKKVGIVAESCHGDLLPHEKAHFITELKKSGNNAIMVGDGVNDAPAMVASDLAVAVRSGLSPGEGVASITLMREEPRQLIDFIQLARQVNATVKQNIMAAVIYNLIGIPIAASGLLNPIFAVTAMLLSSLSVTFNTLYMLKKEQKRVNPQKAGQKSKIYSSYNIVNS